MGMARMMALGGGAILHRKRMGHVVAMRTYNFFKGSEYCRTTHTLRLILDTLLVDLCVDSH